MISNPVQASPLGPLPVCLRRHCLPSSQYPLFLSFSASAVLFVPLIAPADLYRLFKIGGQATEFAPIDSHVLSFLLPQQLQQGPSITSISRMSRATDPRLNLTQVLSVPSDFVLNSRGLTSWRGFLCEVTLNIKCALARLFPELVALSRAGALLVSPSWVRVGKRFVCPGAVGGSRLPGWSRLGWARATLGYA